MNLFLGDRKDHLVDGHTNDPGFRNRHARKRLKQACPWVSHGIAPSPSPVPVDSVGPGMGPGGVGGGQNIGRNMGPLVHVALADSVQSTCVRAPLGELNAHTLHIHVHILQLHDGGVPTHSFCVCRRDHCSTA